jgi:hypothetical protein
MVCGPILGGLLYDLGGFTLPFWSISGTLFVLFFFTYFTVPADVGIV